MEKFNYFDKHGNQIHAGCTLKSPAGTFHTVELTQYQNGQQDLGILATNPDYLKNHPNAELEYYSLRSLDLSEWEVVL